MIRGKDRELTGTGEPETISEIADYYLSKIGGANGTYYQFMQYTQNAGQTGGPASGGGAFWQQVIRQYPMMEQTVE